MLLVHNKALKKIRWLQSTLVRRGGLWEE